MKRALLVGIDHYPSLSALNGCVADATALSNLLKRHNDQTPNWRPRLLTSADGRLTVTRSALRSELAQLFANSQNVDLLFFFAGHGARTPWGAELVTQDATVNSLGVSMNDLIVLANDSPASSVTLILDCCFSGELGDSPGHQEAAVAENFRLGKALLRQNVTLLAASRATEPSRESAGHGAFTQVLLTGLEGGATDHLGNITALSLYDYVSKSFDAHQQRPVLKSHVTEPPVLRVGPPWIDRQLLHRLPFLFATATHRLRLTPEHEGEGRPLEPNTGTAKQKEFDYLGQLRNANLVTTDGHRDHYWVAMEGGEVYLTALGQYFWRLADRGML